MRRRNRIDGGRGGSGGMMGLGEGWGEGDEENEA